MEHTACFCFVLSFWVLIGFHLRILESKKQKALYMFLSNLLTFFYLDVCIFLHAFFSRGCPVESELRLPGHRGVPVLWGLAETRASPVPCHRNAPVPHLLRQGSGRSTLFLEVELSVCERASHCAGSACVSQTFSGWENAKCCRIIFKLVVLNFQPTVEEANTE